METSLKEIMSEKLGSKNPKPKHRLYMTIHPMDDGKFYVEHDHRGKEPTPERGQYAPAGIKELHDHIDKHFGTKEPKEEKVETTE